MRTRQIAGNSYFLLFSRKRLFGFFVFFTLPMITLAQHVMHAVGISERGDEIRSYSFHGLMMGMLLGAKSFSFLVASVKLCVYVVAAIKLSIVDMRVPAFSAFP